YGAAIALIFPSLDEGFGLPVIEAMACGCPVITTNLSTLPEAAGKAAYIVDRHSIPEMIEALRAVRVPKIRERLKVAGECQAAKFRWNKFVHGLARNLQLAGAEAKVDKLGSF